MTPSGTEKGKRDPRMAPGLSKFATTTSTFLRKVADGTIDEAGRSGVYPNWFAGMMEWKIPVGWVRKRVLDNDFAIAHHADYERDGDPSSRRLLIGNRDDKYKQVFLIYSDGGCAIEKYGYRLYRDRMWIVGVVAQILEAL